MNSSHAGWVFPLALYQRHAIVNSEFVVGESPLPLHHKHAGHAINQNPLSSGKHKDLENISLHNLCTVGVFFVACAFPMGTGQGHCCFAVVAFWQLGTMFGFGVALFACTFPMGTGLVHC